MDTKDESCCSDSFLKKDNQILDMEIEKVYSPIKKFFAELLGTTFLIFTLLFLLSLRPIRYIYQYNNVEAPIILTSMIYLFGKISGGHFNPAVSISMCLRKKISLCECFYYIGAQMLGGFLAYILIGLLLFRADFEEISYIYRDIEYYTDSWSYASGFICEMISSFIFVLIIFGSNSKEKKIESYIIIGITYYLLYSFNIICSGDSLNPAMSLPYSIISAFAGRSKSLSLLWIFTLGPIIGGIAGGFAFMLFE